MSTSTQQSPVVLPQAPYRGIEAFRYIDYPIFFARENETKLLLRFITIYRALLLYGDSGAGKSSLINAGLIRAAINDGFAPERLRVQPRNGEEIIVERISTAAEGGAPFLDSIFADPQNDEARVILSAKDFLQKLNVFKKQEDIALPGTIPLLIFDQFEEFITLFEEAPRDEAKKEARISQEAILESLIHLICDQSFAVKVLLVFREDYLAKFSRLFARCPGLQHQSIRLTSLNAEALHDIIRGPFDPQKLAQKLKGDFGDQAEAEALALVQVFKEGGNEISEKLAAELIEAIKRFSGNVTINLSEVQIACQSLWSKKESVAIFQENGVGALLEEYLANALSQLEEDLRDPAMALLSQMVIPPTTRNVISQFTLLEQVRDEENFEESLLDRALNALITDTRIVRLERRDNTPFYELISEFLVPWIVRQKVVHEERVRQQKLQEERRQREDTERQKRKKTTAFRIAYLSIISALIMGLLVWYMYSINTRLKRALAEKDIAEDEVRLRTERVLQTDMVQEARQRAEQATQEANQAKGEAEQAKQEAVDARKEADQAIQQMNNLSRDRDFWRDRAHTLENALSVNTRTSGQSPISVTQWLDYVRWIKTSLNALEGAKLNVDGIYDNSTREAVKKFQRKNHLLDDGIVGATTMAKINELLVNR
jgi:hypothetical protein